MLWGALIGRKSLAYIRVFILYAKFRVDKSTLALSTLNRSVDYSLAQLEPKILQ